MRRIRIHSGKWPTISNIVFTNYYHPQKFSPRNFATLTLSFCLATVHAILTCTSVHLYWEVYTMMRINWLCANVRHQNMVLTCHFCNLLCWNFLFIVNGVWPLCNKKDYLLAYLRVDSSGRFGDLTHDGFLLPFCRRNNSRPDHLSNGTNSCHCHESDESLSTFRQRLKTHPFTKSFFWLFPGLDFT